MDKHNQTICRICGNTEGNTTFEAREMMFGLLDTFSYIECSSCGCIQIATYPSNIEKYYPNNYYSFLESIDFNISSDQRNSNKKLLTKKFGWRKNWPIINKINQPLPPYFPLLEYVNTKPSSNILDIGCGRGKFLVDLYRDGFENLTGCDMYIEKDISYFNGLINIYKKDVSEMPKDTYDIIFLNHVMEHMPEQKENLITISTLLKKNGFIILRIPVKNYAWEKYKENWVQLDAPRHFYIHTTESVQKLAEKCNLSIDKITYDSYSLQFWGSEQYLNNIPLRATNSYCENATLSMFSPEDIQKFEEQSNLLNSQGLGDQAIFFLKKK